MWRGVTRRGGGEARVCGAGGQAHCPDASDECCMMPGGEKERANELSIKEKAIRPRFPLFNSNDLQPQGTPIILSFACTAEHAIWCLHLLHSTLNFVPFLSFLPIQSTPQPSFTLPDVAPHFVPSLLILPPPPHPSPPAKAGGRMEGRDVTQTSGCLYLGSHARRRFLSPLAYAPATTSPGLSSLRSSPSLQHLLRFHEIVRVNREDVPLSPHLPIPIHPVSFLSRGRFPCRPSIPVWTLLLPASSLSPPPFLHLRRPFHPPRGISLLEIPM